MRDNGPVTRAEAVVDRDAIRHNLDVVRAAVGTTPLMAVVKADGYGHGMREVAQTARRHGVEWLGVALPSEALALRAAGDSGPILTWLWSPSDPDIRACVESDIDISVSSRWALDEVIAAARESAHQARVQLKCDTGLSRNGAPWDEWLELTIAARAAEIAGELTVTGLWSHLANADAPDHASIPSQLGVLHDAVEVARAEGLDPHVVHLANSAAALALPDCRLGLVRVGIAMYGVAPFSVESAALSGLRPVMALRSTVALVKTLPAGASVSYGSTWTADVETRVALIPLGYADGIPRAASNRGWVRINGRRCPVLGRIAMDQFVVQVDDTVCAGDEVIVFGDSPTADDWGAASDSIGYEIVTRIGPRVPRRYVGAL